MDTNPSSSCPECGRPLPPSAPHGLCPSCLFGLVAKQGPQRGAEPADQPALAPALERLADYELLEEVGRGGMGVVYKARQKSLNRVVALKMLLGGQFASTQSLARFQIEAETTAQLQHPNIVAIHEVGEHDGLPFLTMDYVQGRSLADLAREQPLPARSAATYLKAIAEAVHYAHTQGVLHRDLKPSNILIDGFDQPRITDFGLAKRLAGEFATLTESGQPLGSPNFMPPEQAAGQNRAIGPASDVYGLGATLYYLVTGRPPFVADTISATARMVVEKEPLAPHLLNPRVPRDLETICLKCLEKEPGKRYAAAGELAKELGRFLRDEPILARAPGMLEKSWRWCRRRPALAGLGAAVLLLAVVATVVAVRLAVARVGQDREFYYANIAQAHSLIEQGRIDRARGILLGCPEHLRHWEWGHLMYLCHQEVATIPAHTNLYFVPNLVHDYQDAVQRLSFDPSSERLITYGRDGTAWVWGVPGGDLLWSRGNPTNRIVNLLFDPSQPRVAVLETGRVAFCSATTGQELEPPWTTPGSILGAAWGPEGQLRLALRLDGTVRLMTADPGQPPALLTTSLPPARQARFSPDTQRLLLWVTNSIMIWQWPGDKIIARDELDPTWGFGSAVDPEGRHVAAVDPKRTIHLLSEGEPARSLEALESNHPWMLKQVEFSPDGRYLCVGGEAGAAQVWETRTGRVVMVIPQRALHVAFSPDGEYVVAMATGLEATVYRITTANTVRVLKGHNGVVNQAVFSRDGRWVATASLDGDVKLWSGRPGREFSETHGIYYAAGYSPDGRKFSYTPGFDGFYVCDAESGRQRLHFRCERWMFVAGAFSPDGRRFLTDAPNARACLWDTETGERLLLLKGHDRAVTAVACSPDGRLLATGSFDLTVRLWDAQTGAPGHVLRGHKKGTGSFRVQYVCVLQFSPDGRLLAASVVNDPWVGIWDVASGQPVRWWMAHPMSVESIRFSSDGRLLATGGGDQTVRLWDVATGRQTACLPVRGLTPAMAFTPDGRRLAASTTQIWVGGRGNPALEIWDTTRARQIVTLFENTDVGCGVQFHPNGRRILNFSMGGTIHQADAFPWQNSDYPGSPGEPLASRIQRYARQYWLKRLEQEAQNDQPKGKPDRSVLIRFDRTTLPPRDPAAPAHLLDLTPHYLERLDNTFIPPPDMDMDNDLRELPTGVRQLGPQQFDLRGVILLRPAIPEDNRFFRVVWREIPTQTSPILVNRRVTRLHLLGSSTLMVDNTPLPHDGLPLARVIWHYTDGTQRQTDLLYGVHMRDWWTFIDPQDHVPAGRVAWTGSNPFAEDFGSKIRLYHVPLDNPQPEAEVQSLQWIAALSPYAPLLVAMTVE